MDGLGPVLASNFLLLFQTSLLLMHFINGGVFRRYSKANSRGGAIVGFTDTDDQVERSLPTDNQLINR